MVYINIQKKIEMPKILVLCRRNANKEKRVNRSCGNKNPFYFLYLYFQYIYNNAHDNKIIPLTQSCR